MISKEQRIKIAAEIAANLTNPEKEGMSCGVPGLVTAPQLYYLEGETYSARSAVVLGFWAEDPVLIVGGRAFRVQSHMAFAIYEEALCASADAQKRKLQDMQAAYLATCGQALVFLAEQRAIKKDAKDKRK